jgi:hypothetical protein
MLEVEISTGSARIFRVDVQVRVEAHPGPRLVRPVPCRRRRRIGHIGAPI